ncbi:UBA/THIF-type NAD/FAD binding protein [Methanocaldococcus vulcanius M7]|uniref:UBA/THIF-type NAD/FAD binding protein n=1 Tax=Methanocaldococcus vulcanius (strain ATCC 700851 / DSM 12094 / M7) TaxID=579137 RepID=C9RF65_METVM|nr:ThiF family adenylyltransferase [Methanocaldococcus vulcanius]ACX72217.1 UBA/THIF-type NAD/FAD binding protein [Methanocaldococcus vulcanius M7]
MNIEEIENKLKPKGEVSIIGCGRLGIRVAFDLLEVHRGGVKRIHVFDNAKIEENDIIHRKLGGKIGDYKVDLVKRFFKDRVEAVRENITKENLDLIKGDVAIICIAGGDTIPTTRSIIEHCKNRGIKTIGTNGVFGIDEKVKVCDAKYAKGPAKFLNLEEEGHIVVGTEKFIRDFEPITPYSLNEISKLMVLECLRILWKKYYSNKTFI